MKTRSLTIGNIQHELRARAADIASQPSGVWSDTVAKQLMYLERACGDRMSDQVFDQMHAYGLAQVSAMRSGWLTQEGQNAH